MLKMIMLLGAVLSFIFVFVTITRGRLILKAAVVFLEQFAVKLDLYSGLPSRGRSMVEFVLWSGLTINTVFAGFVYLITQLWAVVVRNEEFELGVIVIFFMIITVAVILFKKAIGSYAKTLES